MAAHGCSASTPTTTNSSKHTHASTPPFRFRDGCSHHARCSGPTAHKSTPQLQLHRWCGGGEQWSNSATVPLMTMPGCFLKGMRRSIAATNTSSSAPITCSRGTCTRSGHLRCVPVCHCTWYVQSCTRSGHLLCVLVRHCVARVVGTPMIVSMGMIMIMAASYNVSRRFLDPDVVSFTTRAPGRNCSIVDSQDEPASLCHLLSTIEN